MSSLDLSHHELKVLGKVKDLLLDLGLSENSVRRIIVFIRNVISLKHSEKGEPDGDRKSQRLDRW